MTRQQIEVLRKEVASMVASGATGSEFREWAHAYAFGFEDLYEVVKLMLGELDRYWQPVDEARLP